MPGTLSSACSLAGASCLLPEPLGIFQSYDHKDLGHLTVSFQEPSQNILTLVASNTFPVMINLHCHLDEI